MTTSAIGTLYVDHNPASPTLAPWQKIQYGNPSGSTTNVLVSSFPTGITAPPYPGTVRTTDDPLGQQGKVYELTTTPDAKFIGGSGTTFDRVDIWQDNGSGAPWNVQGSEIWEHFSIMVPTYSQADMAGPAWWDLFQHHTSNGIGGNEANGVSLRIRKIPDVLGWGSFARGT